MCNDGKSMQWHFGADGSNVWTSTPVNTTPRYFAPAPHQPEEIVADLCIYGGVSGGITAAIEANRRGLNVVLVEPSAHLGGLTAGGLGMTDIGNKHIVSGLAREFYRRVGQHYGMRGEEWRFEPSVAERIFEGWLAGTSVRVFRRQFLKAVLKEGSQLTALETLSGLIVKARMFIDASYEGDLMAAAGVSYHVGREGNSVYSETLNGQHIRDLHQFESPIDPYVVPGVPASGALPGIDAAGVYRQGEGDKSVQTYCFRMCLTRRSDIRVPFPKPEAYDPAWYTLLKRYLATGWNEVFEKFDAVRNGKTDTNNHGAVSTDFIGMNHGYPEGNYEAREKIFQAHVNYQQGLMWCLANDPEIPEVIREPMREWGLCRDEFTDCGGWPHALYVREARRMVSSYVMTEHHCVRKAEAEDAVGLAAYGMDSHNCRRLVIDGSVVNEGDVQVKIQRPYPISYRSIIPRREECSNLLVTFCLSASHIAFGSIRMEPVLMILSQSAAIAADIALKENRPVQEVPYDSLCKELLAAGIVLEAPAQVVNTLAHAEFAKA